MLNLNNNFKNVDTYLALINQNKLFQERFKSELDWNNIILIDSWGNMKKPA